MVYPLYYMFIAYIEGFQLEILHISEFLLFSYRLQVPGYVTRAPSLSSPAPGLSSPAPAASSAALLW